LTQRAFQSFQKDLFDSIKKGNGKNPTGQRRQKYATDLGLMLSSLATEPPPKQKHTTHASQHIKQFYEAYIGFNQEEQHLRIACTLKEDEHPHDHAAIFQSIGKTIKPKRKRQSNCDYAVDLFKLFGTNNSNANTNNSIHDTRHGDTDAKPKLLQT
jgi:hypothetical protein